MTASVRLIEITRANVAGVLDLAVTPTQNRFVAPNVRTLAEASVYPGETWIRAIEADGKLAGLVAIYSVVEEGSVFLWRFMVDARMQRRGIGEAALRAVIADVTKWAGVFALRLSFVEDPSGPERFYERVGFKRTGRMVEGEVEMILNLPGKPVPAPEPPPPTPEPAPAPDAQAAPAPEPAPVPPPAAPRKLLVPFGLNRIEREPFEEGAPAKERLVKGNPKFRTWTLDESPDGKWISGVWESTPGKWRIAYDEWEFCFILSGESVIARDGGETTRVKGGDAFVIEPDFNGTWEVVTTTRKLFAIRLP